MKARTCLAQSRLGAGFSSLKLVTQDTSFFFFYIEDWSGESGRTDGVCCQLWDKWSLSLESITQMIHPHPAAKLPVTGCLLSLAMVPEETPN